MENQKISSEELKKIIEEGNPTMEQRQEVANRVVNKLASDFIEAVDHTFAVLGVGGDIVARMHLDKLAYDLVVQVKPVSESEELTAEELTKELLHNEPEVDTPTQGLFVGKGPKTA